MDIDALPIEHQACWSCCKRKRQKRDGADPQNQWFTLTAEMNESKKSVR
jgi:hypothetical protein